MSKRKIKPKPNFIGYSPAEINVLNGVIPGGTGVQGEPGVKDTPGGGDLSGITPPPVATAQPVDPSFANTQLIANRSLAIGGGNAAYDTGNLGFDYGYNPDGTINTANPYSRAALYQHQYEASKRGTNTSLASAGLYNSGSRLRQQGYNDSNYAQAEAGNRLAYQRGLHGIQAGRLNTLASAGTGVSDADFAALLRATYPGS